MKRAIYLLITLIFLSACGGPETNVSYKNVDVNGQYRIKVPKYMSETDELNDDASLQYMNGFREAYMIVIDEPKDSFVDIFKQIGQYNDSISAGENYKDTQLGSFKEFVKDFKVYDEDVIYFNNKPSYFAKVDGEVDNFPVTYFFRFVEGKKNLYMLMCWTEQWRAPTFVNTFQEVLLSLSEF